jgi:hypothetical protein
MTWFIEQGPYHRLHASFPNWIVVLVGLFHSICCKPEYETDKRSSCKSSVEAMTAMYTL